MVWNGKTGEVMRNIQVVQSKDIQGQNAQNTCSQTTCHTFVAHMAVDTYMYIHPTEDWTITPREAARIQSFPDSFDFCGVVYLSIPTNRECGTSVDGSVIVSQINLQQKQTTTANSI